MPVPANTVQTFAMVGIREDLSDVITNIAPTETPFYSRICRKGKAKNRTPEWEKDTLAAADGDNKTVEGDDVSAEAAIQPERLKNVVQLFDKVVSVSSTAQAVDTAGRSNELNYQTMKKGKELKRDIEARLTDNNASVLGTASVAGEIGGAEAWLETNVSRGATGADGGFNSGTGIVDAPTDGTQRAFAESLLKDVIKDAWVAGGEPTIIMVGPSTKVNASAMAGIATQYRENSGVKQATILGAADVYVSDFGEHRIVPNRFNRDRTALVLTPAMWECKFLQPFRRKPLAKTGHNDKRLLWAELTLCCKEEKANGAVADLIV